MPGYPGRPSWTSRLLLAAAFALPFAVQAQTCDGALERADGLYVQAEFDAAIALLTECMEGEAFSEAERARAYRLLGLSYVGKGQTAEARTAAEDLMALDPTYEPDPADDPPSWQRLVEEVAPEETAVSPDPPPADTGRADPPPQTSTPTPVPSQVERRGLGALFVQLHLNSSAIQGDAEETGGGGGLGFKLGFPLAPAFIAFGGLDVAALDVEGDDLDYALTVLDLGAQLNIGASRRSFVPYFTAAYTRQAVSADGGDVERGNGFTGGIGFMYFFTPPLSINLGLDVTSGQLESGAFSGATTGVRLRLGLSWFPLR